MPLEVALRLVEMGLAFALLQRGAEHMIGRERAVFALQIILAGALLLGFAPTICVIGLLALALVQLHRFQGPYNGGSDKMALLILTCLTVAHLAPSRAWAELALGYLAFQLVMSYAISGWVKIANPDWRSGAALSDVFAFSAYPASEAHRHWADRLRVMQSVSWAVILFECAFPFALLNKQLLLAALSVAALFHLSNAWFLGLNRFFWIWISAYPALIWFQTRLLP